MKRISTGSPFEKKIGYSRAVIKGDWCFMSGVTGYDYAKMRLPETAAQQTENCIATISDVLVRAGFQMNDIVRVNYIVKDRGLVDEIAPVLAAGFGSVAPAATMVIAEMIEPAMLIEIEVTAFRG